VVWIVYIRCVDENFRTCGILVFWSRDCSSRDGDASLVVLGSFEEGHGLQGRISPDGFFSQNELRRGGDLGESDAMKRSKVNERN